MMGSKPFKGQVISVQPPREETVPVVAEKKELVGELLIFFFHCYTFKFLYKLELYF